MIDCSKLCFHLRLHKSMYLVLNGKWNLIAFQQQWHFIDYPQIKYLRAIGVFSTEHFTTGEGKGLF